MNEACQFPGCENEAEPLNSYCEECQQRTSGTPRRNRTPAEELIDGIGDLPAGGILLLVLGPPVYLYALVTRKEMHWSYHLLAFFIIATWACFAVAGYLLATGSASF